MRLRTITITALLTGLAGFVAVLILWATTHPVYAVYGYPYWVAYTLEQACMLAGLAFGLGFVVMFGGLSATNADETTKKEES